MARIDKGPAAPDWQPIEFTPIETDWTPIEVTPYTPAAPATEIEKPTAGSEEN